MYKIVSIISFFIRQFYLPNPYVKYFDMLNIILVAFIINFIIWRSIKFIKNKFEQEINFLVKKEN